MSTSKQLEHEVEQSRQALAESLAELRGSLTGKRVAYEVFDKVREKASGASPTQKIAAPLIALAGGALLAAVTAKRRSHTNTIRPATGTTASAGVSPGPAIPPWLVTALLGLVTNALAKKGIGTQSSDRDIKAKDNPGPFDPPASSQTGDAGKKSNDQKSVDPEAERDRGRLAKSPSEIPLRGWKDILLRVFNNISSHRVLAIAAGVTFYSLLAIFPAIASLVSLYGLFADASTISSHLDELSGVLPGGAIDVLREQMTRLASQPQGALGLTFIFTLLTSLWSANAGMKAFFDALNVINGEEEKRNFFKLNATSLGFTAGAIVFLLLALGAVVVVPVALAYVPFADTFTRYLPLLRWPLMFVVVTLALAALYRYGPSRDEAKWHWLTWGSAVAAFLWLAASILFSWYTANFGSYNATYGSLGAVVGFMFWIWLSAIVVFLGAELDAEMEHQTVCDTTVGQPQPLGARKARVADTVGAAQGS